jgi:hypothetical protein
MSEQDERSTVRRLGRKDRKRKIDPRGPLFPPEEVEEEKTPPASGDQSDLRPRFNPRRTTEETSRVVVAEDERFPPLNLGVEEEKEVSPAPAPIRRRSTCLPNLIALFFLVATIAAVGIFAIIAADPYTPLNPFPPFTPLPVIITATFLPATAKPPATAGPTATFTPIPVDALSTPQSSFPFTLLNNAPVYAPNGNDQDCNWSSIAGTVTDASGTALNGYGVHISGEGIDSTVFSGAALTFGAGGFELFLNGAPQVRTYSVQLVSAKGDVVSDTYNVTTQGSCDQNVAILAFRKTNSS